MQKPTSAFMLCTILLVSTAVITHAASGEATPQGSQGGNEIVVSIEADNKAVTLKGCVTFGDCSASPSTYQLSDDLKPQVKPLHPGDHVVVHFSDSTQKSLASIAISSAQTSPWLRLSLLVVVYLLLLVDVALMTRGHPRQLVVGMDNRYSNSKFQAALWFSVLITCYVSLVFVRIHEFGWNFWGNIGIPQSLLVLSGASALTLGAAKAITTAKLQPTTQPAAPQNDQNAQTADEKPKASAPSVVKDLTSNDSGNLDLGDIQMMVITIVGVGMYLIRFYMFLANVQAVASVQLPDVDTTILAAFGFGQGAYLAKKANGEVASS